MIYAMNGLLQTGTTYVLLAVCIMISILGLIGWLLNMPIGTVQLGIGAILGAVAIWVSSGPDWWNIFLPIATFGIFLITRGFNEAKKEKEQMGA